MARRFSHVRWLYVIAAGLTALGCGNGGGGGRDAIVVVFNDSSPAQRDAAADARVPYPLKATCDDLPLRMDPGVCIRFHEDGGCNLWSAQQCVPTSTRFPGLLLDILLTTDPFSGAWADLPIELLSTTHGRIGYRDIRNPNITRSAVILDHDVVPPGTTVSVVVRHTARDRRRVTFTADEFSIRIDSIEQLPTLQDCPEGAGAPVPYRCTRNNAPTFELGDWQIARVDSDVLSAALAVLPQHAWFPDQGVLGPAAAHPAPYSGELAAGYAGAGLISTNQFSVADWTAPASLMFMGMMVPGAEAPNGASPDYADGPLVDVQDPGWLVDANLYRNGALVDGDFDSLYPPLSALTPAQTGDNYSHVPLAFGESTEFIPGLPGNYELHVRVLDAQFNGWDVVIPFVVQ